LSWVFLCDFGWGSAAAPFKRLSRGGACHANADLFHGNIREPYEIGCAIQKKRLECAIMIQAALALEKEGQKNHE